MLSHSPEAEGEEAQGVHTCTPYTRPTIHLPGCHPDSLRPSVVSCQRVVLSMESHPCVQFLPLLSCSPTTHSYVISVPSSHMQGGLASPLSTQRTALPASWVSNPLLHCHSQQQQACLYIHRLLTDEDAGSVRSCTWDSHIPTHCQMPPWVPQIASLHNT